MGCLTPTDERLALTDKRFESIRFGPTGENRADYVSIDSAMHWSTLRVACLDVLDCGVALFPIGKAHDEKILVTTFLISVHDGMMTALHDRPRTHDQPPREHVCGELIENLAIVVDTHVRR